MHASDVWVDKLAMFISQRCDLCCWSAVFQRCRRRHRLAPVYRLPTGGDIWREQCRDFSCDLLHRRRGRFRMTTGDSSPNPVQRDILPHRHSQLSDLTIRLCSTTSLKSIILKRWLYHQMFKLSSDQFNSQDANHVNNHFLLWLVNRLTADVYRYYDNK